MRQIKPRTIPAPVTDDWRKHVRGNEKNVAESAMESHSCIYGILMIVFGFLSLMATLAIMAESKKIFGREVVTTWWQFLGCIVGSIAIPMVLVNCLRLFVRNVKACGLVKEHMIQDYDEAVRKEVSATSNAEDEANKLFERQPSNLDSLHTLLRQTKADLDAAQQNFTERAFTPFWEAIESAVVTLRQFEKRVSQTCRESKRYAELLENRDHTFPTFPLKRQQIPSPANLLKVLNDTIALAQRDFQFSSIFEQRRTTSAIVTGFRNMHEAMQDLKSSLDGSLARLQQSLESGFDDLSSTIQAGFSDLSEAERTSSAELQDLIQTEAALVAERDKKHQKFTEEALDNIQNRRKPYPSETKDRWRKGDKV